MHSRGKFSQRTNHQSYVLKSTDPRCLLSRAKEGGFKSPEIFHLNSIIEYANPAEAAAAEDLKGVSRPLHKHWRPLPFHSPNWRPQSESTQRVQPERKEKGERDQIKSGSAFPFRNIKIIKLRDHKNGIIF